MTALRRFFSFPLLAKELTEAAARRRTYVLRVTYALLLFVCFALLTPSQIWKPDATSLLALGAGRVMYNAILALQYCGIALFLPAMMCGRITAEKERDSLSLLFLTALRPWAIVLEKFLGGLVPMLSFLLLGLPLTAIAYAFGGVTPEQFAAGLYLLLLATLQVGALALACSAWFRTTVSAFVATYLLGVLFYLGPLLCLAFYRIVTIHQLGPGPDDSFALLIPPSLFDYGGRRPIADLMLRSVPILVSILVFLVLARVFLVRRANAPASQFFRRLFRRLDVFMLSANRLTGGQMLLRPGSDLPGDDPIAWREMSRRSLGKVHHLVRVLLAIELPIIFISAFSSLDMSGYERQCKSLSVLLMFAGTLAILALSVQAANTLVSERVQQTLEVLLTTPLSGREIVRQKARALRRFCFVLAIPLLTVCGVECYMESGLPGDKQDAGPVCYAVCAVLSVAIYLPLVAWLSLWVGMKMRTRFKAIIAAVGIIVGWCGVPFLVVFLSTKWLYEWGIDDNFFSALLFLSPIAIVAMNEFSDLNQFANINTPEAAWLFIGINFAFYATVLFFVRHRALASADRYLRR